LIGWPAKRYGAALNFAEGTSGCTINACFNKAAALYRFQLSWFSNLRRLVDRF
jgi:hypothetical protein